MTITVTNLCSLPPLGWHARELQRLRVRRLRLRRVRPRAAQARPGAAERRGRVGGGEAGAGRGHLHRQQPGVRRHRPHLRHRQLARL